MPASGAPAGAKLLAVWLALAAVTAACGGGSHRGAGEASRSTTSSTASRVTTTTLRITTTRRTTTAPTAPSTTASPPTVPPVGFPTARDAATHLLDAWRGGNRDEALRGTDRPAVDAMFAVPVGPVVVRGCDTGEFTTSGCQYKVAGGGLQLNMEKRPVGWMVTEALFAPG